MENSTDTLFKLGEELALLLLVRRDTRGLKLEFDGWIWTISKFTELMNNTSTMIASAPFERNCISYVLI
jgi:hypothetical protein